MMEDKDEVAENAGVESPEVLSDAEWDSPLNISPEWEYINEVATSSKAEVEESDHVWPKSMFCQHKGSVFCGRLADSTLAVTGGEDDKSYVWKVANGDVVMTCLGHKDSVIGVAYSHDLKYLATADMSGYLQVWNTSTKSVSTLIEIEDITWIKFHKRSYVLIVGTHVGNVYLYKIPGGDCKMIAGAGFNTECGVLLRDGRSIIVGYDDGCVRICDMKNCTATHTLSLSQSAITCLDVFSSVEIAVAGSCGGELFIISLRNGKLVGNFNTNIPLEGGDEDVDGRNSIESVVCMELGDDKVPVAVAGGYNKVLLIYDVSRQVTRHSIMLKAGITKILSFENLVYAACSDGYIYKVDALSGEQLLYYERWGVIGESAVLDLDLTKDGQYLLATNDSGEAAVWHTDPSSVESSDEDMD